MFKVVIEVEMTGEGLLEASERLIEMAQSLTPVAVAPVVLAMVPPPAASSTEKVATLPPAGAAEETTAPVVLLDADNRPWDGRIDSSGASTTQDGRWKIKRGADKALVASIKAQYATATPPAATATATPPPPATEAAAPPPPPPAAPAAPPVPAEPVMTEKADGIPYKNYIAEGWSEKDLIDDGRMLPRGAATTPAIGPVTYEMIVAKVTERVDAEKLLPGEIEAILKPYAPQGVTDMPALCAHPELWAPVHAKLVEAWG